jgi:hypothetical protein
VRVEAGRNQQDFGAKLLELGDDAVLEGGEVVDVVAAGP